MLPVPLRRLAPSLCGLLIAFAASPAGARADPPRLFPQLALSRTQIAFAHAGDIWLVSRDGGAASQLTSGPEEDSNPSFSPDGTRIAFSRAAGGDADIFVAPVAGGTPTRLTFHPSDEVVRGWSPDGADILFTAARTLAWQPRLYLVRAAGGPGRVLPIPVAWNGTFLPDGRIVYAEREVLSRYPMAWRGYRGGSMGALVLADPGRGTFTPLSTDAGNDRLPVAAGGRLLIASDRAGGLYDIWSLDVGTGRADALTHFSGSGIGALAGGPDGAAAYERGGELYLLDPSGGRSHPVAVSLTPNRNEMAERQVAAADYVESAAIGSRGDVAIGARGDILLIDAGGAVRHLTASSATNEQSPVFSPDGNRLAFLSFDEDGDRLVVETLASAGPRRTIRLPSGRGGYFEPIWSPDGRHLALSDIRAGLWLVDMVSGSVRQIDAGTHMNDLTFEAAWSPDGQWLAYVRYLANNHRALFLRNVADPSSYRLTSGDSDVGAPAFAGDGREIYFTASGNAGAVESFSMYQVLLRPIVQRRIMAARIDLTQSAEGLRLSLSPEAFARRVRPMPFEARDYSALAALPDRTFLALARQWPPNPGSGSPANALFRLDSRTPDSAPVARDVDRFALSADRSRLLVNSGSDWSTRPLAAGSNGTGTSLSIGDIRLTVSPPQEWRQIYRDAWRTLRDTFYDPAYHGQDIAALEARYARYLPGITRRADLNVLLYAALGNLSVSHIALSGGDSPSPPTPQPRSGLLGADFEILSGRFRFSRIYTGSPFATEAVATGPFDSVDPAVRPGAWLLRINGAEVTADRDLQSYLLGAAGRPTSLTVAETPDGHWARTVTVEPLASETALRTAAWVEDNRARVRARSNGSVAYVYIPDYQERGMAAFIRQWTAASDRDGVVIDQRYNPGGFGVDFILDLVLRRPLAYYMFRDARDLPFPVISNSGPRALIVNERNGSASDSFPWLFQRAGAGPVVGRRTGGAGIGHIWRLGFVDGGGLDLPLRAFFNPDGSWDVENRGVIPDIKVETDPAALLRGEDAQLDAAVDAVLERRRQHPTPTPRHPPPLRYPPQSEH